MIQGYPIPVVPLPPEFRHFQYTPFVYQQLPTPLPPVTEPLPDVQRQYEQEEQSRKIKKKETSIKYNQPKKSGLFGTIVGVVEEAAVMMEKGIHDVTTAIDDSVRSNNFDTAQRHFFTFFRMPTEILIREYMCRCISGGIFVSGNMYISEHYVGFCGDQKPSQNTEIYSRLAFLIPLRNILSIQLGIHSTRGTQPVIQQCDGNNPKADSVLLYTNEGSIHQFFGFWSFKHVYNVLDHTWRASFLDPTFPPFPLPINQPLPPFTPIDRKSRPGLAQANQPIREYTQTETVTQTTEYTQAPIQSPQYAQPLTPVYTQPPTQPLPNQPFPNQPFPNQPFPNQPLPNQPLPNQPLPNQPFPNQPFPNQPLPNQPFPNQPLPNQPLPNQPLNQAPVYIQSPTPVPQLYHQSSLSTPLYPQPYNSPMMGGQLPNQNPVMYQQQQPMMGGEYYVQHPPSQQGLPIYPETQPRQMF